MAKSNSLKNLQAAASQAAGRTAAPSPKAAPIANDTGEKISKVEKPSRVGKIVYSFHLPEDYKRSLRLIQAQRGNGCSLEGLAAEAFNDLFMKYNVPTVDMNN